MASLYTQQEKNIRLTYLLFSLFFILIIGLGWIFSYIFNDVFILYFASFFSIISSFISYWYSDKIALKISRAIPVSKEQNPYLYNMVENLCITAGLPMPRIYVIPEPQINAFATGRNEKNAAIAVTQGALEKLENEELEGVLAHELAHIGNKDILVSTIAVVLAGIISMVSDFFIRMTFLNRRNRGSSGGILFLIGIVFAILAPIGAMLIQLAISRKREFLADATGALITRYPDGLVNALEKISKDMSPMKSASDANAHLWISNPFKGKSLSFIHKLFMTHPPIEERIKALRQMAI
jgi:heat shock protein HtpX